jgi:pimeloyl-ACP methyl ester carboxylesterase
MRQKMITSIVAVVIITISLANLISFNYIYASTNGLTKIPVYMISTWEHQNLRGVQVPGYNNNYQFSDINQLFKSCPPEVAIFIHGWSASQTDAKEQLDRVKLSLESNHYNISLIGLSWDSNTDWTTAKALTKENGPMLAQFLLNFKEKCTNSQIRLIAHSLGARVALSTLDSLDNNPSWNNEDFKIKSVHLMGAAVDSEEVSTNPGDIPDEFPPFIDAAGIKSAYRESIQDQVVRFYNLFDPEDNALQFDYPFFDGDSALGQFGRQLGISSPSHSVYLDENVQSEIKPIADANGDGNCDLPSPGGECSITDIPGDNHMGYMGFRNPVNTSLLKDDGAINVVVSNWRGG